MMDNITTDRLTRISEVIMANGHQNISSIGSHEVPFTQKGTTEYYVEYIIGNNDYSLIVYILMLQIFNKLRGQNKLR